MSKATTARPFKEELPELLRERGLTLRGLARDLGGVDHAYLSRMIHGQVAVNAAQVHRISTHLGLPDDYFPEVRQARTIEAIREDPELRDEIYFRFLGRRRARSRN